MKPPLGLQPRWVMDEFRLTDIISAMHRYVCENKPIPLEWIEEMIDITKRQHIRATTTEGSKR